MGTNYYLLKNYCQECHRGDRIHIGKSSSGWVFGLHVYPDDNISNLEDWIKLWNDPDHTIRNEYNEYVSSLEMFNMVTGRKRDIDWDKAPHGYSSWSELHRQNDSQQGLNGLLRNRLHPNHCIGHGSGTWDYLVGDFS